MHRLCSDHIIRQCGPTANAAPSKQLQHGHDEIIFVTTGSNLDDPAVWEVPNEIRSGAVQGTVRLNAPAAHLFSVTKPIKICPKFNTIHEN